MLPCGYGKLVEYKKKNVGRFSRRPQLSATHIELILDAKLLTSPFLWSNSERK